jgi:hypothetical protein
MATIEFQVQGSAPNPYTVTFVKEGSNLAAYCTCAAGAKGQPCKHRLAILAGIDASIVSANAAELRTIAVWLPGSPLQRALDDHASAERGLEQAQRSLSATKKRLAAAMA